MPAEIVVTGANKRPPPTSMGTGVEVKGLLISRALLTPEVTSEGVKDTLALTSLALLLLSVTRNKAPVATRMGSLMTMPMPWALLTAVTSIFIKGWPILP